MLRSVESYGGLKVNLLDPEVPESEEDAEEANRKAVDLAQFSRTSAFAVCAFTPSSASAPATLLSSTVTIRSHMGTGSTAKPVVTKTGTGLYTVTWPSSFDDEMNPPVTENIVIALAKANYTGATRAFAQVTSFSSVAVNVALVNSSLSASDMSAAGSVIVEVWF